MNTIKYFSVKSGKNKGFYFAIEGIDKLKAIEELRKNNIYLGIINKDYNQGFYNYHNIKDGFIFALGGQTSYNYNKKVFNKYIDTLINNGYTLELIK